MMISMIMITTALMRLFGDDINDNDNNSFDEMIW